MCLEYIHTLYMRFVNVKYKLYVTRDNIFVNLFIFPPQKIGNLKQLKNFWVAISALVQIHQLQYRQA